MRHRLLSIALLAAHVARSAADEPPPAPEDERLEHPVPAPDGGAPDGGALDAPPADPRAAAPAPAPPPEVHHIRILEPPSRPSKKPKVSEEDRARRALLPPLRPADPDSIAGAAVGATVLTWLCATGAALGLGAGASVSLLLATSTMPFGTDRHELSIITVAGGIGAGLGILLTYVLLPEFLAAFADDKDYLGDTRVARDEGLQRGSLPLLGILGGLGLIIGGDQAAPRDHDGLIIAGVTVAAISYLVAWGLELSGVIDGYQRTRHVR